MGIPNRDSPPTQLVAKCCGSDLFANLTLSIAAQYRQHH